MIKLFPPRESLVSDVPAGDGNVAKLFLQCSVMDLNRSHGPVGETSPAGRLSQTVSDPASSTLSSIRGGRGGGGITWVEGRKGLHIASCALPSLKAFYAT